jgi:ribonuclease BN (tRNA processing enzyme)
MTTTLGARLRLTVLGCSTAAPHPATPTAGFLVEWGSTAILLDCGQGVIRNLQKALDPHDLAAIVIGHMHADHYLDVVGLRYLYPWGEPAPVPLPIYLPPGGRPRLDALANAVSERVGFFDTAFDAVEYDPDQVLQVGDLRLRFVQGRHYVPAWGVVIDAPDGSRLAYTGDTGPSASVEEGVRGADLLLVESALGLAAHDDPERGHLTPQEAIELARRAQARSAVLVHYGPARKPEMDAMCAAAGPWVRTAVDGLTITVRPASDDRRPTSDASTPIPASGGVDREGAAG